MNLLREYELRTVGESEPEGAGLEAKIDGEGDRDVGGLRCIPISLLNLPMCRSSILSRFNSL
jgi:hypothetical protein